MARIDDYLSARKLAADDLANDDLEAILLRTGFDRHKAEVMRIPFLNRSYGVEYPTFEFRDLDQEDAEIPVQEQVLILHYMQGKGAAAASGQWVSYREIPGASFYFSAFVKRAIDPLKQVFGNQPENLLYPVEQIGGKKIEIGDSGWEIQVFPKIRLQLILWQGDDEFPAEANILFDQNIDQYLSPEDIAWLAGMVVYRLMALSRQRSSS
jgi:hypothetical protein